jgi:Arc/MetJ family transcription regulator
MCGRIRRHSRLSNVDPYADRPGSAVRVRPFPTAAVRVFGYGMAVDHMDNTDMAETARDYAVPRNRPPIWTSRVLACTDLHLALCILMCMRTNIDIDDEALREAQRLVGTKTKRETVNLALRELVARHRQLGVLDLRGRVRWEGDLAESRRGRA